jgi:wyosine [tRNA(Phe)-imidazoG37] synthetase (radical SAM superfamily)
MAAIRDHSRVYGEFVLVYPVISRRSRGLSLGVNLNPDKICNFDCIYCEVDRRTPGRADRVDLEQLRLELGALIRLAKDGGLVDDPRFRQVPELTRDIRDIAFSGDGEPTMVHNFADCVSVVAELRREHQLASSKIVLITDAAGLDKADVRRGLEIMDANGGEIWGKLDAGTQGYYRLVNRSTIRFERILNNLLLTSRLRPIVIQSLFLRVHGERITDVELAAYCDRLEALLAQGGRIKEVHAYTVARPTPERYAERLSADELQAIAEVIRRRTGLAVEVFP